MTDHPSAATARANQEFETFVTSDRVSYPPPPVLGGRLLRLFPRPLIPLIAMARSVGTWLARPYSLMKLARLPAPLRLHLGSGFSPKEGWVNIDLIGARADLFWNLRRGLPFAESTADAIFHEHLLEHLRLNEGYLLTRECFRVLRPGGLIRIGVPDAGALLTSYAAAGDAPALQGYPTRLLGVQEMFYEWGHRTMYDFDTLSALLGAAGFTGPVRSEHGGGLIQPCPDSADRKRGTLYVEARKE